jgi:hypothetical protein
MRNVSTARIVRKVFIGSVQEIATFVNTVRPWIAVTAIPAVTATLKNVILTPATSRVAKKSMPGIIHTQTQIMMVKGSAPFSPSQETHLESFSM